MHLKRVPENIRVSGALKRAPGNSKRVPEKLSVLKKYLNRGPEHFRVSHALKRAPEILSILKFTPMKSCSKYARRGSRCCVGHDFTILELFVF